MYKYLLFDCDNTLLDFGRGERSALSEALSVSPLAYNDEVFEIYHKINDNLWKALERGEVTREVLRVSRFEKLFSAFGYDGTDYGKVIDDRFLIAMQKQAHLIEGAEEVLSKLSEKYKLYLVTNATARVQRKRLALTPFDKYFTKYYISEEIGVNKPDVRFLKAVTSDIGDSDKDNYLLIGDSLTSDIKGAVNFGIDSCYFDIENKGKGECFPTYTIKKLTDLLEFL